MRGGSRMRRATFLAALGLAAGIAALTAHLGHAEEDPNVKPTITSGKQVALMADIAGSVFRDVNLAGAEFDNVNLAGSKLHNINLSGLSVSAANLGGAHFKHIGPAPDASGKQERQKPVTF